MSIIDTDRLVIRRYKKEDGQDLYEYLSDQEVVRFEPYEPFTKEAAEEEAVKRVDIASFYAVELKEEHKLIGNIYFEKGDFDTWEIGYVFNRHYQRKGYATEAAKALIEMAFNKWGARRIIAMCNPINERSWKLMERLGMRREGTLRQNIYFKCDASGQPIWLDTYEYGLLKEEWLNNGLLACEMQCIQAFSEVEEGEKITYYRDAHLQDMFAHNFSLIKKECSVYEAIKHIEEQESERKRKGFLQLYFEDGKEKEEVQSILQASPCQLELETLGRYLLTDNKLIASWREVEDCKVIVQADKKAVEDGIKLDVATDGTRLGEDFCTRRARRFGEVSMNHPDFYNHLIYKDDECIGNCALFVHNGVAKVENFVIHPDQRGKGYGITLFKAVCQKALELGANAIYLNADEEDTPKELYKKLGFIKVGIHYEALWMDR